MKFLHLSDLHIGKSVNGFSMLQQQINVFGQVISYIQTEKPQAIVIAGDVYDRSVPSVEAVKVFDDFLTELARQNIAVMVVSGNHDSPERLSFASRLLSDHSLFISSVFRGEFTPITLQDEYGEINFWLLPFVRPSTVRSYFPDSQIETFTEAIATIMQSAAFDEKKRNVLISHQFYVSSGVIPVRSESEIEPIGGLDAVDTECLLPFDYVALGHLHGSQKIGSEAIRYAGSPLKYSFSESKQKKGINLVEMGEKGQISIRQLPILPMHDMREIRGRFEEILSEEFSSAQNKNDYLKITLLDDEEIIDPMERIRKVYPFAMVLAFDNKKTQINLSEVAADAETQESLSTFELFADFFLKTTGQVMSQEQSEVVKALLGQEEEE